MIKLTPLNVRMYNSHHLMSNSISGLKTILWYGKEFEWIFSEERRREMKTLENLTHLATQMSFEGHTQVLPVAGGEALYAASF